MEASGNTITVLTIDKGNETMAGNDIGFKCLRKAVTGIAGAVGREPVHTQFPSVDLDLALETIPEAMREKAMEWYIRGIKRGMAKATQMMADGEITMEGDTVVAPAKMKVRVRTRHAGGDWEKHEITVKADEIGFE